MASSSPSSSFSSLPSFIQENKLDLKSIQNLMQVVSLHFHGFLSDPVARKVLQLKCNQVLNTSLVAKNPEFSDPSVLSDLHRGIEEVELAVRAELHGEKSDHLDEAERLLQAPASVEEDGIESRLLVCISYFYLALVGKLREDEWQMGIHFLQSLIVSPEWVRTELGTELWVGLFGSVLSKKVSDEEEDIDASVRQIARRYKNWLMYYQVISYGEIPRLLADHMPKGVSEQEIGRGSSFRNSMSTRFWDCIMQAPICLSTPYVNIIYEQKEHQNVRPLDNNKATTIISYSELQENTSVQLDTQKGLKNSGLSLSQEKNEEFNIRCLHEMLEDTQSEASVSLCSHIETTEASDSEERSHEQEGSTEKKLENLEFPDSKLDARERYISESYRHLIQNPIGEVKASYFLCGGSQGSVGSLNFSMLHWRESHDFFRYYKNQEKSQEARCFSNPSSKFLKKCNFPNYIPNGILTKRRPYLSKNDKAWLEENTSYKGDDHEDLLDRIEKTILTIRFSDHSVFEDAGTELLAMWKTLNSKRKIHYSLLKQIILDELLAMTTDAKKESVIKASISMLLSLISEDEAIAEDVKKKDYCLQGLASALKRKIYEAAILIYLINPSPAKMRNLELLPSLLDAACNSKGNKEEPTSAKLTPTTASIAIIETMVTSFDYVTNNMHLAALGSPQSLSKLVNLTKNKNLEECVALATILIRCMRLNGNCRKFLSQVTPVDSFLHLLRNNDKRAKCATLEYFHELLHMPRSSATHLLQDIWDQGTSGIMDVLMTSIQEVELEHKLLAANILLQLEMMGKTSSKSIFRDKGINLLLKTLASDENPTSQSLSASILSNLGGTYAWTGESYTAAWLVRKAGLNNCSHKNMIRNIDWSDPCLQDKETEAWSSKLAKIIIRHESSLLKALAKGIESKIRRISRESLIFISWLGNEMATSGQSGVRYSACEMLLSGIVKFLHPGEELDERVLACLCIYNYTSGRGKQKLLSLSEGSRESLRRLSDINWMAEEVLKVTDYFLPMRPRVSCVHTQILEIGQVGSGATTSLIFYRGCLCAGYSDGYIKVWDIKDQRATLVWEVLGHKKAITSFALVGQGVNLLSSSLDKTLRIWGMSQKKLECLEVIETVEPVQKTCVHGELFLAVTQKSGLKVYHPSRRIETICKNKQVKSLAVVQGRLYLGCVDSSIQEVDVAKDRKIEIRAPTKSWRIQNKPIKSLIEFRGWLYSAGHKVEGSNIKEWKRNSRPQFTMSLGRAKSVQAMAVVQDFIYLNCSHSQNTIQVWLRNQKKNVSRILAGTKITCLLTANDIIFCGTDLGLIKGWIPL